MIILNGHIYIYEFLPRIQNIQLISIVLEKYNITQAFEFNKNYCILVTKQGISFYNWKKNEIIRTLSFHLNNDSYKSILVNKCYLVGICDDSIFIYNLINSKLNQYEQKKNRLSLLGDKFDYILNIYNDYFIVWNKFDYHIIKTNINKLKHIYKNSIKKSNLDLYKNLIFTDTKKRNLFSINNNNKNNNLIIKNINIEKENLNILDNSNENENGNKKNINKYSLFEENFDKNKKLNLFGGNNKKLLLLDNNPEKEEFDFYKQSRELLENFKNEVKEEIFKVDKLNN